MSISEICKMVAACFEEFSTISIDMERVIDSMSIIDSLSTIVMMYGVSDSVKRAT